MPQAVVKIQSREFHKFLDASEDVATRWKVADNEPLANPGFGGSYTVEELMEEIEPRIWNSGFVYVYDPLNEDEGVDHDAAPEVKASELDDYIVRSSMGKDWLYFACSPEEGSSDRRLTLIPDKI